MSDHAPSSPYGHWQRWEMQAFELPEVAGKQRKRDDTAKPAMPDVAQLMAEIEQLRQAAVQRGHAEGYQEGYAKGHEQGVAEGLVEGKRKGHEEGLAQGKEQGFAEGQHLAQQQAEQLSTLLSGTQNHLENLYGEMGEALLNTAVRIASHVVQQTLASQPEQLLHLIRTLLESNMDDQSGITLYVSPSDHTLVHDYLQRQEHLPSWRVVEDDSISAGGCRVRTALGDIDATLETRWHRAIHTLNLAAPEASALELS
ncbi:flagellar assembly protein FliH [Paenalcaligenes sp. Me52]|uniref:flagellar assembly protein FliH n=1 Tax=Paenalcaligenes sp. Me52 TaxID=3392038 RepID=UPI003D272089